MKLEMLQANDGDCLLLHYGNGAGSLVLIDGGSKGIYHNVLEKRLNQLRGAKRTLKLRLIVISHIDADHITGILDMFRQMSEQKNDGQEPRWQVASLWHNTFEKMAGNHSATTHSAIVAAASAGTANLAELVNNGLQDEKALAVVASIKQGKDLQRFAGSLTKTNPETKGHLIVAPKTGLLKVQIDDALTFTILGPHQKQIDNLEKEWNKSRKAKGQEQSVAADYLNRTVPNLSSIVFLVEEKNGRGQSDRILFTGDAGGDLVLEGLKSAGLFDRNGKFKVDVLKVQHHGSKHSVTQSFFETVLADAYVISGNGAHGIPDLETLVWLSKARKDEPFDVYMTNRQLQDKGKDYTKQLDKFLNEEKMKQSLHRYHFREDNALSIWVG